MTQRAEPLFHNHPTEEAPRGSWEYPLIRYTRVRGHPAIVGIGAGATALTNCLLPRLLETTALLIMGRKYACSGFRLNNRTLHFELGEETFPFGLHRWIGLNKDNYKKWKQVEDQKTARHELLSRTLTGHLRVLANQMVPDFSISDVEAHILRIDQIKKIRWQKADLIGFTVIAESRLRIPDGLGIGRLVAYGFGETKSPQAYRLSLGQKPSKLRSQKVDKVN